MILFDVKISNSDILWINIWNKLKIHKIKHANVF